MAEHEKQAVIFFRNNMRFFIDGQGFGQVVSPSGKLKNTFMVELSEDKPFAIAAAEAVESVVAEFQTASASDG